LAEPVEEPKRDDGRWDGWDLEDRMAHCPLKRRKGLVGPGQPQHAGHTDADTVADALAQLSGNGIPEGGVLEATGQVDRGAGAGGQLAVSGPSQARPASLNHWSISRVLAWTASIPGRA